ncbi:hypothetical protein SGPA1_21684 [Streptomyces misionensis JCM 4497]
MDRCGVLRRAGAGRGRVPQLRRRGRPAARRAPAGRPGGSAGPDRARDDGAGGRAAGAGRQSPPVAAGRVHLGGRHPDQRLLRAPARQRHAVAAVLPGRGRLRGPRPCHRGGPVDRQPRRPRLRVALRVAGRRGGLRERRRPGEVRAGLRRRVGQGHEPRPVRPRARPGPMRPSGTPSGANGGRRRVNGIPRPLLRLALVGVIETA